MNFAFLVEPPFNFIDANGCITGCDVVLARYVFRELYIKQFNPIETEFAELLPGLRDDRWRMTTGMFVTPERSNLVLFSRPIWALSDGLLVRKSNPCNILGYTSIAENSNIRLAVIRDQCQHSSALQLGVSQDQIIIYNTYKEAALAVQNGDADAYASVAKAHSGFMAQNPGLNLAEVLVATDERRPAFGCFAFSLNDEHLRNKVDGVLNNFLGSKTHRDMVATFNISETEVDLLMHDRC